MPADDTTSGETFEDAPDDLATGGSRSARSLDESIAVIDFPDESSIAAECRKYKEEREVFAREAVALRRMLRELLGEEASGSMLPAEDADERLLASPTPLHSMLDDCSRLVLELNSVVRAREQEIESLRGRSAEVEVSREVMDAYPGSSKEESELAIRRIVASVDALVGQYDVSCEGADEDGISLVERKTSLLAERHRQILLGIQQLEQVLAEVKPDFVAMGQCDHANILGIVSEELVSSKRNEADFMQKMNTFWEENKNLAEELQTVKVALDAANAEARKAKADFKQMEHKLATTKEKLSMAVTKGKSLVQHRDSLKQALAEKTAQLDGCMAELQQKSDAMQAAESRVEELKVLLDEKSNEHERCLDELRETYSAWEAAKASVERLTEQNTTLTSVQASLSAKDGILERIEEVMSEASFPEDLLSLEMTDRLEWLVEQKKIADMIFSEHRKVKDILGSADLPHAVLTGELDSQIHWLLNSLYQIKEDAARMQDESSGMLHRLASHESKLNSMHEEVDRLTIALLEEKQEKDILANEHVELMSLYNATSDKFSVLSSQYSELVKAFAEVSDVQLEGNEIMDGAKLVEQCLISIQGRAKSSPVEYESFEKLQTQVYTLDQELTLCKIILEEDKVDRSEMMRLSGELQSVVQETCVLKNEKDSLQKELERVEEKSSLLREKLSMAVKKGKGLAQEREGLKQVLDEKKSDIEKLKLALDENNVELDNLKQTLDRNNSVLEKLKQSWDELNSESENIKQALDEKNSEVDKLKHALDENNSEIENLKQTLNEKNSETDKLKQDIDAMSMEMENLKYEISSRESAIMDLKEQVEQLSSQVAHSEKLQLNIMALNDEKAKVESMLTEARVSWDALVESISSISLPFDNPCEEPINKIGQIVEYIEQSQAAKSSVENELYKANEQVTLQARRLADALSTLKVAEDELSRLKEYMSSSSEEKEQIQSHTAAIEEELEKTNEELAMTANKLEDANVTINSLEDALSQARANLSVLDAEKKEAEAKYETETGALNAKLAKCLEELDKSHGNLQSHSTEHHGYLEKLSVLVKVDSLLSLMAEEFGKKVSSLREMGLLVRSMHEQLAAKGFQIDPITEDSESGMLFPLPDYDNFITERMASGKIRKANVDGVLSFSTIVEQLSNQSEYLSEFFKALSGYMNDNITLVHQSLQRASSYVAHTLEEHGILRNELQNKDNHSRAQEAELLSLQKELRAMTSNCIYCSQQIQSISDDLLELGYAIELATGNSSTISKIEGSLSVLKDVDAGDYTKVSDALLSTVNKLKLDSESLSNMKGAVFTLLDELKMRLKQTESAVETSSQEQELYVKRASVLEKELETLKDECKRMEIKIQEYQERENMLKARELELLSLEQTQSTTDTGVTDVISKDQLEVLVERINKLNISSAESHLQRELTMSSSPVDKLFSLIDEVDALRHELDTLRYENEDLHLNLESHAREMEQLKEASRNSDSNRRELESKSSELLEVTVSMERMIQRLGYLGGKEALEDNKPTSTQALLSKLEKLIIASNTESGNAKSVIQELGAKLQAREKAIDELSTKVKMFDDLHHVRLVQPESNVDRAFEASSSAVGSEISDAEDLGQAGKASISSVPTAAHSRTMRKGSSDHLVLNIGRESERLITAQDSDDKGRVFKSLHTSGIIPAQGKHIADRVDGIWVSGSQILMNRPRARLGLMVYSLLLHLWLIGSIL